MDYRKTVVLLCIACLAKVSAQEEVFVEHINSYPRGALVEDFEEAVEWTVEGNAGGLNLSIQRRKGAPGSLRWDKEITEILPPGKRAQDSVLGMRVEVTDVGEFEITVKPENPVKIGKGVQSFSCHVHSNNLRTALFILFSDRDADPLLELNTGHLNYMGWKKLTVSIPSIYYAYDGDLYFYGFKLILPPMELRAGVVYFYFDFITAILEGALDE